MRKLRSHYKKKAQMKGTQNAGIRKQTYFTLYRYYCTES